MKRATKERREKLRQYHSNSAEQYRVEVARLRALGWRSDEQTGRLLEKHRAARRAVIDVGDRIARALTPTEAARYRSQLKAAQRELDMIERKLGLIFDPKAGVI